MSYALLRLGLDTLGDIGINEVKRAEEMLLVQLLAYGGYFRGHV